MNKQHRYNKLLALLEEKKILATTEIMQLLDISPATARRDIAELDAKGLLRKVRNGAECKSNHSSFHYINLSNSKNAQEKQRIAMAATKLCQDGESVFLTCGSTMLMLGQSLCGRNVQIITNYLPLANYLIENDHDNVVIMGGQYTKSQAITLSLNTDSDSMYAANTMFTSGKGLTVDGLYKTDMLIANSEQKMLPKVNKLVVLLDSTKLNKQVGMLFTELARIDVLITGKEADKQIIAQLKQQGLEVILA